MRLLTLALIGLIAALHLYIAYFEMFAWETRGPAVFPDFPKALFADTVVLAANQGLYNGFLAVGLIWSLFIADRPWQNRVVTCFLVFVLVAGLYGAATASVRILFVQAGPALLTLILLYLSKNKADRQTAA